ncbi:hypothetical protein KHA80_02945 [Anaerobacillus sp. HL2]|nr:hypothetical protein KHA80_02945 [Anaerobacillus sp. HL2]
MYEHQTYEAILARMLDKIPDDIDKREGSIIYDATFHQLQLKWHKFTLN